MDNSNNLELSYGSKLLTKLIEDLEKMTSQEFMELYNRDNKSSETKEQEGHNEV